jgi:CRP-like cAMP-binding protein
VEEGFVAKLIDVGSQIEIDEGTVVWDESHEAASLFLVLNGLLEVETSHGRDERGPGQVVGDLERLDGTEDVRVVALTEARLVAVDRAAYETALFG